MPLARLVRSLDPPALIELAKKELEVLGLVDAKYVSDGNGKTRDVWNVNVERSYHEELVTKKAPGTVIVDTAADTPVGETAPELAPHVLEIGSPPSIGQFDIDDAVSSANSGSHEGAKAASGRLKETATES